MTPVRVLGLHEGTRGLDAVLVVETLTGDHRLGFHIPLGEAARLARVLGRSRCRRVPIYDLVRALAEGLGGRVVDAVLDARAEGICARLLATSGKPPQGEIEIRCHPADAIGLALQASAPIHATRAALKRARQPGSRRGASELTDWLERVRPADFAARSDGERPS